jgi:hypothetical protein
VTALMGCRVVEPPGTSVLRWGSAVKWWSDMVLRGNHHNRLHRPGARFYGLTKWLETWRSGRMSTKKQLPRGVVGCGYWLENSERALDIHEQCLAKIIRGSRS